jgi:hypothetical protein
MPPPFFVDSNGVPLVDYTPPKTPLVEVEAQKELPLWKLAEIEAAKQSTKFKETK